jgi:hypothetical protein
LRDEIHANAVKHGFYHDEEMTTSFRHSDVVKALQHVFFAQRIALIHSELSEALEADREEDRRADIEGYEESIAETHQKYGDNCLGNDICTFKAYLKDTVEDGLCDAIIRILDLCGYMGIDIEKHVELKMRYNELREYKHGKNY